MNEPVVRIQSSFGDKLLKIAALIHHCVWGLLGLIIIGIALVATLLGPAGLVKKFGGQLPGVNKTGLMIPENQPFAQAVKQYSNQQQDCINKTLGEARFNELMADRGALTEQDFNTVNKVCFEKNAR